MAFSCNLIYLNDLDLSCEKFDLIRLFSKYGEVDDIKLIPNFSKSNTVDSYNGIIRFAYTSSVEVAIQGLNGVNYKGRPFKISISKNKKKKTIGCASVHISFYSNQIEQIVTQDSLFKVFSKFGKVVLCCIKKFSVNQSEQIQTGYGFIHYSNDAEGMHSALWAVENLDNQVIHQINYKCNISGRFYKQLENIETKNSQSKPPSLKSNLPVRYGLDNKKQTSEHMKGVPKESDLMKSSSLFNLVTNPRVDRMNSKETPHQSSKFSKQSDNPQLNHGDAMQRTMSSHNVWDDTAAQPIASTRILLNHPNNLFQREQPMVYHHTPSQELSNFSLHSTVNEASTRMFTTESDQINNYFNSLSIGGQNETVHPDATHMQELFPSFNSFSPGYYRMENVSDGWINNRSNASSPLTTSSGGYLSAFQSCYSNSNTDDWASEGFRSSDGWMGYKHTEGWDTTLSGHTSGDSFNFITALDMGIQKVVSNSQDMEAFDDFDDLYPDVPGLLQNLRFEDD